MKRSDETDNQPQRPATTTTRHLNPRALILKRQARDKIVPNIKSTFNSNNDNQNKRETESRPGIENTIMKIKRFVQNVSTSERHVESNGKFANEAEKTAQKSTTVNALTRDLNKNEENVHQQQQHQGTTGSIGDEQEEEPNARIKRFFKAESSTVPSISNEEEEKARRSIKEKKNSSHIFSSPIDSKDTDDDTRQRNTRSLTIDDSVATNTHRGNSGKTLPQNAVPITTSHNALYERAVPFEEVKSLEIVRRALTDKQFEKLKFLDDQKVSLNKFEFPITLK